MNTGTALAVEIRPATRELLVGGAPAEVSARAFDLLQALVERRDRIVLTSEILDLVWPGLGRLQLPDVRDVAFGDRSHLRRKQRGYRHRFARQRHELDLVAGTALVDMDDRADIACLQAFIRHVLS